MPEKPLTAISFFKYPVAITWKRLAFAIIGYGILIRTFHFLYNRSLWLDEIYLSASLLKMNLLDLVSSPLDYQQQAPIGLLLLVKSSVLAFGENEKALRLIPFLCGIIALFAFYRLASYYLSPAGVFISTAIIATAPFVVYHSVEIKQYSSGMLMTIIAILLFKKYNKRQDWPGLLIWGSTGAIILWLAHSAIFLFAGIAFGLSLYHILKKNWKTFLLLLIPFGMWMISFLIHYFLFIKTSQDSEWLTRWFQERNSYMPVTSPISTAKWILFQFYRMLEYPLGLLWSWDEHTFSNFIIRNVMRMPLLPMACFALGMIAWFRMERKSFLILVFPILLTLIASGLKFYPVYERLTVFLAPILVLFITKGVEKLIRLKWVKPVSVLVIILLLAAPFSSSISQLANPHKLGGYKNAEYRKTFVFVENNQIEGDSIYVYWNLVAQYKVYKQLSRLSYDAVEGNDLRSRSSDEASYLKNLETELNQFDGPGRVWLIYDNTLNFDIGDMDERTWYQSGKYASQPGTRVLNKLKTMGKILKEYKSRSASAYLIDLKGIPTGSK